MTVSLTNTSGRCQVFVLAHETYCRARGECACDIEPGRSSRRTARSLTLASGMTSPELDDAVLAIPELVRAVRKGELVVKRHVTAPPAVTAPTLRAAASSDVSRPADVTRTRKKRGGG